MRNFDVVVDAQEDVLIRLDTEECMYVCMCVYGCVYIYMHI